VKPIKRHQKHKLTRPYGNSVIPEEDDNPSIFTIEQSSIGNQGARKIAHLFQSQNGKEFSTMMSDCNSTFTFDDCLTNFGTMDGLTTDNDDNEIIQPTPIVSMKSHNRSMAHSRRNDGKSVEISVEQPHENKENIPPPYTKSMCGKKSVTAEFDTVKGAKEQRTQLKDVTNAIENAGSHDDKSMSKLINLVKPWNNKKKDEINNNELISSTVHVDEERVEPQPEIARQYEYDTAISEAADSVRVVSVKDSDDYSVVDMDVESPIRQVKTNTQATYTVQRKKPSNSEVRRPKVQSRQPEPKNPSTDHKKYQNIFDFGDEQTEQNQRKQPTKSAKTPRGKSINEPIPIPSTSKQATERDRQQLMRPRKMAEEDKLLKFTYRRPQSMGVSKNENLVGSSDEEEEEEADVVNKTIAKKGKFFLWSKLFYN
jgi:hypothetical protein